MGRELRRKQAKKEGKKIEKELQVEEFSIKKAIILLIILVVSCLILWLGAALFKTKELDWLSNKDEEKTNSEIPTVNNSILAVNSLNRNEEEYYVYYYDFNDEIKSITTTLNTKLSASKVYKVDTSSGLNKNYVSDESNPNAKSLEELKVKAPTLIKVHHGEIIEYYEGKDVINNSIGG